MGASMDRQEHSRYIIITPKLIVLCCHVNIPSLHFLQYLLHIGEDTAVEIPAPMGQPCIFYPSGSKVAEQMIMNLKQRNLL